MLAEIVTLTIPDWICCVGWGVLCVGCFILVLWLLSVNPVLKRNSKVSNYNALQAGQRNNADIVAPNSKVINCSVCNDKGTIKGRQCSCQVAKYWEEKNVS